MAHEDTLVPHSEADIQRLEAHMLELPQADCSVVHRFGPGVYIRELTVQGGAYVIGHHHRDAHLNQLLSGSVTIFMEDGSRMELQAPACFVAPPGRKLAYVHETMVWQNIYATTETDIDAIEAKLFEPSPAWLAAQSLALDCDHSDDLEDYLTAIAEFGFEPDDVRAISENTEDQCPFPYGEYRVVVAPSHIEGRGLFATGDIAEFEAIAPARLDGKRTPAGRFTNHAKQPNAIMVPAANGDIYLFAIRPISGCKGSALGEEITVNYRQVLNLSLGVSL